MTLPDGLTRRRLLGAAGTAALGAAAGCQSGEETGTTVTPAPVPSGALESGTLVVRYDDAGRTTATARAMDGLIGAFTDRRDGIDVGIQRRTGRRPDGDRSVVSFGRLGAAIADRAAQDELTPFEVIWEDVSPHVPNGLVQTCYLDRQTVAVPQTVSRLNTLYYNPSVLDAAEVDPDSRPTVGDLVGEPGPLADAVETLFAAPMRSTRERLALWESVLSSRLVSQRQVDQLRSGTAAPNRLTLRRAMGDYAAALSVLPDDAGTLSPATLLDRVLEGRVGFARLSSRAAAGLIDREDATYGEDWAVAPMFSSPFAVVADVDGFAVPVSTAEFDRPRAFVRFATEPDTQRRFGAIKGSIPARLDAAAAVSHHPAHRSAAAHYREATMHVPSMATGVSVREPIRRRLDEALVALGSHESVETAVDGVVEALENVSML